MPAGNNETLRVLRHSERTTLLHAHLSPCLLESQPEWRTTVVICPATQARFSGRFQLQEAGGLSMLSCITWPAAQLPCSDFSTGALYSRQFFGAAIAL